jgi:predicted nucleotidyltransferase
LRRVEETLIDENTIRRAVELLQQAAPGSTVIVFGSCARGDVDEDSDLDVLVVEPTVTDQWDEMVRLHDALSPLRIPADVLVVSQKTFDYWADTPNTIYNEALRYGRMFNAVP